MFARYYPDRDAGLNVELGGGAIGFEFDPGGDYLRGAYASCAVGESVCFARQWSLGLGLRLTGAELSGKLGGVTLVLMPGIFGSIAWH